jgi:hypothetical protein
MEAILWEEYEANPGGWGWVGRRARWREWWNTIYPEGHPHHVPCSVVP